MTSGSLKNSATATTGESVKHDLEENIGMIGNDESKTAFPSLKEQENIADIAGLSFVYRYGLYALFILFASTVVVVFYSSFAQYPVEVSDIIYSTNTGPKTNVVLFGDSLINRTFREFQLGEYLQDLLDDHAINFFNEGLNGNTIENIRKRVPNVLSHKPSIVVLFWDSDCSDWDEEVAEDNEIDRQLKYRTNVHGVVESLLSGGVDHVLLGGPGLLGEGPFLLKARFQGKENMLARYNTINREVAEQFPTQQVTYVDVRNALRSALPTYWFFSWGYFTLDGEHLNNAGSQFIATLFSSHIDRILHDTVKKEARHHHIQQHVHDTVE